MVSVMAEVISDKGIEIGVIGFEGMTGLPLLMGDDRSPDSSIVQLAGRGLTIRADVFGKILWERPGMHKVFLRFAKSFGVQTSHTALSNGRANISQRLARWLLMAHDRSRGDDLAVTHELLAMMLGVRRPGVTEKLLEFKALGLVRSERGLLGIMDRAGLEGRAGAFYGEAEKDYDRLFPCPKISTPHVKDQKSHSELSPLQVKRRKL
jgi:CRP-like cAMP-binding protein